LGEIFRLEHETATGFSPDLQKEYKEETVAAKNNNEVTA